MRLPFTKIWTWIAGRFRRPKAPLRTIWVEELPDNLDANTIYVAGENEYVWFAAMLCPCGCGETLHMNLQAATRPCWQLLQHRQGTVTLHPSVWRKVGCRSHFFIRRGRIHWCENE